MNSGVENELELVGPGEMVQQLLLLQGTCSQPLVTLVLEDPMFFFWPPWTHLAQVAHPYMQAKQPYT